MAEQTLDSKVYIPLSAEMSWKEFVSGMVNGAKRKEFPVSVVYAAERIERQLKAHCESGGDVKSFCHERNWGWSGNGNYLRMFCRCQINCKITALEGAADACGLSLAQLVSPIKGEWLCPNRKRLAEEIVS